MPKTPAQAALDDVIEKSITLELKPRGFRKSGRTYRKPAAGAVQVLNVQSDKWSTADEVRFTINLGVFFPAVHAALRLGWQPSPEGPKEYECTLHARIGELLPGGKHTWWELRPGDRTGRLVEEVNDAVRRFAIPWLDSTSDFETSRSKATGGIAVAFELVAGERDRALRMLRELLRQAVADNHPSAAVLSDWLASLEAPQNG